MPVTWNNARPTTIIRERTVVVTGDGRGTPSMGGDMLALEGGTLGALAGTVAGTTLAVATRLHPVAAIVGTLAAGTLIGATLMPQLRETTLVRHHTAAAVGAMAGGGALALGALSLGAMSGAVVAGAAAVGVVAGACGLSKLASLLD